MKSKICIVAISLAAGLTSSWAQDTWVQKANFGGTGRYGATGFSIDSKGYMGCGYDFNSGHKNDFWEYDPGTNAWTQKADFGGLARETPVGFAIGSKGYIGTGYHFGGVFKDFYEYDPASNTWTQKADFGGTARNCAIGFSIGSKGYIGTGIDDSIETKDFWEYDPSLNSWTQKADFGGAGRHLATAFAIGDKGYIGTGQDNFSGALYQDIWEYDPSTDTWNQKADFGGGVRTAAGGFAIGGTGYIAMGGDASRNRNDLWQYNPSTNLWTQKADFPGTARTYFATFTIGGNGYIGIGDNYPYDLRDFWEYTPDNLPIVMLSTLNVALGVELVGTRSAAQFVTLTNSGPVTLNVSSIAASGDFVAQNNCGSSLPPGESCTIKVAFIPSAKGVRTGSVTITDDAADSPQTIALTGTGTVVQLSPMNVNFGNQRVGTISPPHTVTLTNTGSTPLNIRGIGIVGSNFGDFVETTTCGSSVPAHSSCAIDVRFAPAATGRRGASMKVRDDGGGGTQAVALAGTGVPR